MGLQGRMGLAEREEERRLVNSTGPNNSPTKILKAQGSTQHSISNWLYRPFLAVLTDKMGRTPHHADDLQLLASPEAPSSPS